MHKEKLAAALESYKAYLIKTAIESFPWKKVRHLENLIKLLVLQVIVQIQPLK